MSQATTRADEAPPPNSPEHTQATERPSAESDGPAPGSAYDQLWDDD